MALRKSNPALLNRRITGMRSLQHLQESGRETITTQTDQDGKFAFSRVRRPIGKGRTLLKCRLRWTGGPEVRVLARPDCHVAVRTETGGAAVGLSSPRRPPVRATSTACSIANVVPRFPRGTKIHSFANASKAAPRITS